MRVSGTTAALLTSVVISLGMAVDSATGATAEIGAVGEIRVGALPSPITTGGFSVQVAEATGTYAVPRGYGIITAWSHSTGTVPGLLTFRVYRPTRAPQEFLVLASDTRPVTASTVQVFPVRIPVRPGDRIGLTSDDVQLAYESFNPADRIGFFSPDPPVGTIRATDGQAFQSFKLDVAATLQSVSSGTGAGPGGVPLPAATQPRIFPSAFAAAPNGPSAVLAGQRSPGAKVTYRLNVPAMVRFTVQQTRPGRRAGTGRTARCLPETKHSYHTAAQCRRTVMLRSGFSQSAKAAGNSFRFTGRLGGRKLKPGSYALVATPRANGRSGSPVSTSFRIVK